MRHSQSASNVQDYYDPYEGVARSTNWIAFDENWTTVLGPVPRGHQYQGSAMHIQGGSGTVTTMRGRQVEDNGSGTKFLWGTNIISNAATLYPEIEGISSLNLTFRYRKFTLEEDDIIQFSTTTAPAADHHARIEYLDRLQQ